MLNIKQDKIKYVKYKWNKYLIYFIVNIKYV